MDQRLKDEIARRLAATPPSTAQKTGTQIGDGQPNVNSSRTLEKLRGLTRTLSAQLAGARQEHVVRITTLATELVDLQNETIAALEARLSELQHELDIYRTWEESREVAELIEENKRLKVDKDELTQRVGQLLLEHVAVITQDEPAAPVDQGTDILFLT